MSTVLLLHSALGLRPAVEAFADRLRAGGSTVATPDYYDGQVFADTASGIAYRDRLGPRALLDRIRPVVQELPPDTILAGFSLGAAFAQRLAADRPGARAVVLLHHVSAPRGRWPGQPVQVHRYAKDPWISDADVEALRAAVITSGATFEDYVVPGTGHLFTDLDGPDGDATATALAAEQLITMVNRTQEG